MLHDIQVFKGPAHTWYWTLCDAITSNHSVIPCRQGVAWEWPHSFVALLPEANNLPEALATADTPRRPEWADRVTFSILYSLRRILGYHDTVLFDKYPILNKYVEPVFKPFFSRALMYSREDVPESVLDEPWVSEQTLNGNRFFVIDQMKRAVYLLADPNSRQSKRALVDFGDGYKARCTMSWLFVIRGGTVSVYTHMRSNDILIGLPSNLIDARVAQAVIAACTGAQLGFLHHQADLVQIYERDIANQPCVEILNRLRVDSRSFDLASTASQYSSLPIVQALEQILRPYFGDSTGSATEGVHRYLTIMDALEHLFWKFNGECSDAHRACVEHVIGRFRRNMYGKSEKLLATTSQNSVNALQIYK